MESYYISQAQQSQNPLPNSPVSTNIFYQPGTYVGLLTGLLLAVVGAYLARSNMFANTNLNNDLTKEREKNKKLEETLDEVREKAMSNAYASELSGLRNDLSKYNLANSEAALRISNLPTRSEFERLENRVGKVEGRLTSIESTLERGFAQLSQQISDLRKKEVG